MKQTIEFFQSSFAQHLGWTLVHAIWQILIFAIIYFAGYFLTKKATVRYWLGMSILLGQVVVSGLTFGYLSTKTVTPPTTLGFTKVATVGSLQQAMLYLQQNLPLVVSLWCVGTMVLLVRLGLGYFWVYRLKTNPLNTINDQLITKLETLKQQMGITQPVEIKTSLLVQLPVIMGIAKPIILFPATLLSGFSAAQIEAILAHELAHLKRYDFLWNGIQSVIEVIYFFHPVVWLISSEIRKERENCCDDLAVRYTGNQVLLAKTLVQLQEFATTSSLVMAFGKKRFTLLERVKRIVGLQSNRNFTKESLWIIAGLIITFFAFAQNRNSEKENPKTEIQPSPKQQTDTTIVIKKEEEHPLRIRLHDEDDFTIYNEKVFFNGKEVEFSPENKALVKQHLQEIQQKDFQLQQHTKSIEQESQKIQQYSLEIQQNSKPIQEISEKMRAIGEEMAQISEKYAALVQNKKMSEKERERLADKMDKELAEKEAMMQGFEAQIEAQSADMEANEPAMQAIEAKIEAMEAPIEAISSDIDEHIEAIVDLLPNEIRQKVQRDFAKAPRPPKTPKAPKAPKAPHSVAPPPPPAAVAPPPPPAPPLKKN